MSDHLTDLAEAVRGVLSGRRAVDAAAPPGVDTALWNELESLGFVSLAVPEDLGGGGGTLGDAAVLVGRPPPRARPFPSRRTFIAARC
ncbi:hypothetical protein BJF79_06055 [Actinomadura sp. CNU-125]|uniref:hypothetical protein n=1 Tax=Actinomadura sp. CNU-125 TaxID=1904961 RepID=UPI000964AFA8|nr:hypothetical protein [Actinomadura sp. CNU-125]OLT37763.1 hypothetical protein BJF79_06055 [Actinomadura sp. CNU-125]